MTDLVIVVRASPAAPLCIRDTSRATSLLTNELIFTNRLQKSLTIMTSRHRGVVYDVGLNFNNDRKFSVEPFSATLVQHDIQTIAKDLHASAVRIEGEEIHRLVTASRAAHECDLTVFFNPWKMHATAEETAIYVREAAREAEKLRLEGLEIVLIVGCEYSIFSRGVFPGETFNERVVWMTGQVGETGMSHRNLPEALGEKSGRLNEVLRELAAAAREEFGGKVTYSAGSWELVDWSIFDIVGIDYYRRGESAQEYTEGLEAYRLGKPLAVMEVGCCAYQGAAPRGDGGFALLQGVNDDGTGKFLNDEEPVRSETEQADYVETQLGLLRSAGVDAMFVFVFSFPAMKTGDGSKDLDKMGFSLVKTFPEGDPRSKEMPPWEPKEAFHRLAKLYAAEKDAADQAA